MSKDSPPLKGLKTVGAGETIKGVELLREWQVEDAGGGCRAFSEVIVLACLDTGEVFSSTIPLTWDDGFSLEEKACSQLIQMMLKAHVEKDDFFMYAREIFFIGFITG